MCIWSINYLTFQTFCSLPLWKQIYSLENYSDSKHKYFKYNFLIFVSATFFSLVELGSKFHSSLNYVVNDATVPAYNQNFGWIPHFLPPSYEDNIPNPMFWVGCLASTLSNQRPFEHLPCLCPIDRPDVLLFLCMFKKLDNVGVDPL